MCEYINLWLLKHESISCSKNIRYFYDKSEIFTNNMSKILNLCLKITKFDRLCVAWYGSYFMLVQT